MVHEANSELVRKVVGSFNPDFRYLVNATVDYSGEHAKICRAEGRFVLEKSEYMFDVPHLTQMQAVACINQLSFVAFAQLVCDRKIPGHENLSYSSFLDNMENVLTPEDTSKFSDSIDPTKDVYGQVDIKAMREMRGSYVCNVEYRLGNSNNPEDKWSFNGKRPFILKDIP